jgi:hypothetical protein
MSELKTKAIKLETQHQIFTSGSIAVLGICLKLLLKPIEAELWCPAH